MSPHDLLPYAAALLGLLLVAGTIRLVIGNPEWSDRYVIARHSAVHQRQ